MSINQHQFEQLTEMGISLWQHRTREITNDKNSAQANCYLDIDLNVLASLQLFHDILLALKLTIGEINHQNDHLDLGLFNWYFTATPHDKIQWHEQQLLTPSLTEISKSPMLKKQLWQLLTEQTQ
ncbi:DNA polymerase III subunit psi [Colwellia psychrerythraea]|uniref:DNA polymerase III psi subunit n=1 Tax=Colwellia psychrerythraea TaxID=28229 RepID=A0A099KAW0_COLPS|nr:DNA polymerase III subunit psi [Colwellia psychrerythraea]KGJ87177.1 DNA polymerase III psi subunit [Colwellia psychrerythraea]